MVSPTLEGRSVSVTHQVPTRSPEGERIRSALKAEPERRLFPVPNSFNDCVRMVPADASIWGPPPPSSPDRIHGRYRAALQGCTRECVAAGWEERPPPINARISRTTPSSGWAGAPRIRRAVSHAAVAFAAGAGPKSRSPSYSVPSLRMCQTVFASLQASAFVATIPLVERFLRACQRSARSS